MKKYIIRVNCPSFQDIEVEAESEEEAIDIACSQFNCEGAGGEFEKVIK